MINIADVGKLIKLVLEMDRGEQEGKCPEEQIQGLQLCSHSLFMDSVCSWKKPEIFNDFFINWGLAGKGKKKKEFFTAGRSECSVSNSPSLLI